MGGPDSAIYVTESAMYAAIASGIVGLFAAFVLGLWLGGRR